MRLETLRRASVAAVVVLMLVRVGHQPVRGQSAAVIASHPPLSQIAESDLRTWLTTLSSDAMGGRAAFTEGYGLAAGYVSAELARLGVEPLGIDGTYLQPVVRTSYRVVRSSSVTVRTRAGTRTFEQDEHVVFPALAGGPQTLEFTGVDFVGYGLPASPSAKMPDTRGRLVVLMPGTPSNLEGRSRWPYPPSLTTAAGRADALVADGAGAAIAFTAASPRRNTEGGRGGRPVDLVTVLDVTRPRAPSLAGDEEFFEFLLAGAPAPFSDLQTWATRGDALVPFTLADVRVTVEVDHRYEPVRAERTHNVVGVVRGSDPVLRDTFVLFGAHLDHVGTASGNSTPGRVNTPIEIDPIWNGADDDGSGSSAVLAIAKAMAAGPKPKRSMLFVWHGGEEEGLLGSQAMADAPVVPLDGIEAVINIDMIGRNRDNDADEADTVYLVGADRISTDLHNLIVVANQGSPRPLTLDYHYNDPGDPESFYTRSDHYSYASHGIPAAFFFTGPHDDYHANTDTVDKILFPKLARVTQLIYESGFALADRSAPLRRDNLGPRSGRGFRGTLPSEP